MRAFSKYHDLRSAVKQHGAHKVNETLNESFESGELKPDEFSIGQLAEALIPNYGEIVREYRTHNDISHLREGGDAIETADFSIVTRNIVTAAIRERFTNEAYIFTPLIPTKPAKFRYGEIDPLIGDFGDDGEVVNEKGEYPELAVVEDWIRTPPPVKRGGKVSLTWEMTVFDQTGQVLQQAAKVGDAIAYGKEIRAVDCIVDENTTAHRYRYKDDAAIATYNDNTGTHTWDNLAASNGLVDWTKVDAAEQLLYNILDPITGRPVEITGATDFIVTREKLKTAQYILNATQTSILPGGFATSGVVTVNNVPGNMTSAQYNIRSSRVLAARMATDTSWFIGSIAESFAYMQVKPLTVMQAPPNSYREFNNDILVQYKAMEMGAFATVNPRKMVKSTVA